MTKKKGTAPPRFSAAVSDFLHMMSEAQEDYTWNSGNIRRMDQLTQDYLHKLELGELDYKERARVATALAKCRKLRRASKDTVEVLEPLMQFLDSEKGRQMTNLMKEALGKTRRVEERMDTRVYYPRVLQEEPW